MTNRKSRSWGERVDSAIVNSSFARFSRSYSASRREAIGRQNYKPRLVRSAMTMVVSVVAVLVALVVPDCILGVMGVLAVVNLISQVQVFRHPFTPPLDERELAVQRASNASGYIAATIVGLVGLFTLMIHALLDTRMMCQIGYEAAMFIMLGGIVVSAVPSFYRATQYRNFYVED